jgi:glycosyltransferase involved in cell wall biosynthesis
MEHNKDSLVSIILPCSRVDSFLEQSLNSILSQTYRNFELIIIANGVSEEELFLLEKMSKTDGRIKLLHTLIKDSHLL